MTVQAASRASDKPAPIHTEDDLPEDVTFELHKGNLVRAADLAIEKAVPHEKVRELQLSAIRQFIEQLHNFEGAKELVSSYGLNDDEVRTILQKILENPGSHKDSITWFNRKKGRMISATLASGFRQIQYSRNIGEASNASTDDPVFTRTSAPVS